MRALALAQAWRETGGVAEFLTASESPGLVERVAAEGFDIRSVPASYPDPGDLATLLPILGHDRNGWVVIDGYHFDQQYVEQVRATGCRILLVDDLADRDAYGVDIVLNQNLHATGLTYAVEPSTRLLLGTDYVLLRSEFRHTTPRSRTPAVARRLLVTLGGADPHAMTERVLEAIRSAGLEGLECRIVIGSANPRAVQIGELARQGGSFEVVQSPPSMPQLMRWAELAIASGGTTVWELAYTGVPALLLETGPAEAVLLDGLERVGLNERIGGLSSATVPRIADRLRTRLADAEWRRAMAALGRKIVDGRGCERVISAMLDVDAAR